MPLDHFSNVSDWVFDLDHTLYPATSKLFSQLEVNMERFLMREFGLTHPEAKYRRSQYWRNHGTTLAGLMHHHGTDPISYLAEVQQIDMGVLDPNPDLAKAISSLPGRKIVFTNGSRDYAQRATKALGLFEVFEAHFGIDDADFISKPNAQAYDTVFTKADLNFSQAAMFEDDPRNLKIPHKLGLKTVLVGKIPPVKHVQFHTQDLTRFLTTLNNGVCHETPM